MNVDEEVIGKIKEFLGVDSLQYMTLEGLVKAIGLENGKRDLCMACLTGSYPTPCGNLLREKAVENFQNNHEQGR